MQLNHQKVAVIGLGNTGRSCVAYLLAQGATVSVYDTRTELTGLDDFKSAYPDVAVHLGMLAENLFTQSSALDLIVVSPGVAIAEPALAAAIAKGILVVGDIELFCQGSAARRIAITGSNAKSTVTTLVGSIAQADGKRSCVAGNIGQPVLTSFQERKANKDDAECYVLELSSFQLETTFSLAADVASILNVTPDHMDRYASFSDYAAVKRSIYAAAKSVVFNRADPLTHPEEGGDVVVYSFGLDCPAGDREAGLVDDALVFNGEVIIRASELKIPGRHNIENALAAIAIAAASGFSKRAMQKALRDFCGLPHRCQWVVKSAGVNWYNDSKGTNVGATIAALQGLSDEDSEEKTIVLIAGGVGKGADFAPLAAPIEQHVKAVLLYGESANDIADAINNVILQDSGKVARKETEKVAVHLLRSLEDAVALAHSIAVTGDSVLLSPACASFDMFRNYEERGELFANLVTAQLQLNQTEVANEQ